ncbi:MAG: protocatechuate 4,5-dioxygenase subunit alpha [Steroidobacteraceae bacterium]
MTGTPISGTYLFDGQMARKGYALNKMCYSFNDAKNRQEFRMDEAAYCDRFGLSDEQKLAIKNRSVLALLAAGGNIYYLAKFAGIFGLNVQDIGAQQTGLSVQAFKARLASYAKFNAAVTAGGPLHG